MFNWLRRLFDALHLRWAYWQGQAIRCDLCRQLAWGGFQHDDGRWTCTGCCVAGTKETPPCSNRHREPLHVNWLTLEEVEPESCKHWCPVCHDGMLLMHRSSETGELLPWDVCTLCGQMVIYDDMDFVRKIRR